MRVYGHVRTAQDDDAAAGRQRRALVVASDLEGRHVARVFQDIVDGLARPVVRPDWAELMAAVRPGDILVVASWDRISRGHQDLMVALAELGRRGVDVVMAGREE
jgi:DNA invertase Pin-like site-specific DNA recombinase